MASSWYYNDGTQTLPDIQAVPAWYRGTSGGTFWYGEGEGDNITPGSGIWGAEAGDGTVYVNTGVTKTFVAGTVHGAARSGSTYLPYWGLNNSGTFTVTGADSDVTFYCDVNFNAGTINVTDSASLLLDTGDDGQVRNNGSINLTNGGKLTIANTNSYWTSVGNINIDGTSQLIWKADPAKFSTATITLVNPQTYGLSMLIDNQGTGSLDYSGVIANNPTYSEGFIVMNNDLYYFADGTDKYYVDSTISGDIGTLVGGAYYLGINAYSTVAEALAKRVAGKTETLVFGTYGSAADVDGMKLEFAAGASVSAPITNTGNVVFASGSVAALVGATGSTLTLSGNGVSTASGYASLVVNGDVTAKNYNVNSVAVATGASLTVDKDSVLSFAELSSGQLTLANTGTNDKGKVIDYTGTGDFDYATAVSNWDEAKANFTVLDNDLFIGSFNQSTVYVSAAAYADKAAGSIVDANGIVGYNEFATIDEVETMAASSSLAVINLDGTAYDRNTIYLNSTYGQDFGDLIAGVETGKNALFGFNAYAYADRNAAIALASADAAVVVTGGDLNGNLVAAGHNVSIRTLAPADLTVAPASAKAYVYGGGTDDAAVSGNVSIEGTVTLKAVLGGAQLKNTAEAASTDGESSVAILSAAADSRIGLVAGGSLVSTDASFADDSAVAVNGDITVTSYLVGGSIQSNNANVTVSGDSEVTIAAGTFGSLDTTTGAVTGVVTGGGMLQNSGTKAGSYTQVGNVSLAISGGTYDTVIMGAAASNRPIASTTGSMTLTGNVDITIDTTNAAVTLYEVYAGGNGKCTISGNTTITFAGTGANLNFTSIAGTTDGGICGDNAGKAGVSGTRNLVFDGFTGDFTANNIKKIDAITLDDSTVTFTQSGLNLTNVKTWNIMDNSKLSWGAALDFARNNFAGDNLAFGTAAGIDSLDVDGSWVAFEGSEDSVLGWDDAASVSIFGLTAELTTEGENSFWQATAEGEEAKQFKLAADGGNLVITRLA